MSADSWLIAIVTLVGAILGSASAAWFMGRMAGREFREAVIKEVAGIMAKAEDLELRFTDHMKEARERDRELLELGKIAARLEAIVSILAKDMVVIREPSQGSVQARGRE